MLSTNKLHSNTLINGRFSILNQIGQGSFSKVYICLDNEDSDKLVAVKTLISQKISDPALEATILKDAKNVGIPKYLGKGYS